MEAPLMQQMDQPTQPWEVGYQNVYQSHDSSALHFGAPEHTGDVQLWRRQRRETLLQWGKQRESHLHRRPKCLMDQMVSGSGLYPLRLLEESWFTQQELDTIKALESALSGTMHQIDLAKDMMAPVIYDIEVIIVLDNSGSMAGSMLSPSKTLDQVLQQVLPVPYGKNVSPAIGAPDPRRQRMCIAVDVMRRWQSIYKIMGIDPWVYHLTPTGYRYKLSALPHSPQIRGLTPMTEALATALDGRRRDREDGLTLILALTDGEASNMCSFNKILTEIQNEVYGNVQVCIMGISLVPKDIEWFENEECDETRIRTIEAFEVEQRQIQLREVVNASDRQAYNYEMHCCRALVTNFFPADYDYECHLQNFRHRVFISVHRCDRKIAICHRCCCNTDPNCDVGCCWYYGYGLASSIVCSACFLATGCHCCGWGQGERCCKCQKPDLIDCFTECCEGED